MVLLKKDNPKQIFQIKVFLLPNFFLLNSKIIFAENDTFYDQKFRLFTDKKSFFRTPKMILHKIKRAKKISFF
jgi:hypothetical protein